ncbi:MAG: ATP-dependent protease ATPase subunit HslU [Eubacteriales bacterium]|nr:ATP-dependent protease ATPase subunit HslU [Eubacteriales bacterium]MDD3880742.1 ATP-dependent protease ATPase subunit HslU [Eubacteriales bacterium]MDD3882911.1 ATP-dependent protease ATPase subunit HslU [Eubacteriales bacterium]MDD4511625.1 ATP-dependent protease ATPase subunit HslU [Eubacteriales bacterium]
MSNNLMAGFADTLTPREVVKELDRYIIGQDEAKRMVAIALRNRYRRSMLDEKLREEISPKNILMIGPTGVGKTEIARRLAKLVKAPFLKVEATKFTEVGYVGRDVESIIRDLMENSIRMVRKEAQASVRVKAEILAEDRLANQIMNPQKKPANPLAFLLNNQPKEPELSQEERARLSGKKQEILEQLRRGELENTELEVEVEEAPQQLEVGGASISIGDITGGMMPKKTKMRRVRVSEARKILIEEESEKLIDEDAVKEEAVRRAEQQGIVFIDEIDKICGRGNQSGADVSREGVQRDILPIIEGSTVNTKYGAVRTDFMLFIAAGAFHVSKITDLIPELQGRFPVHVSLKSLTKEDFAKILTQPDNALTLQYSALLSVDHIRLTFDSDAIAAIADAAYIANESQEDIGARRLHAIFEELLEDISFNAGGDMPETEVVVNGEYVREHLKTIKDVDMKRYIL